MTKKNSETYGNNIKYLIDCVSPAFTLSKYVPKQTFYNLNISLSTLKKALYGENLSIKTARQIADSFCHYLSDSTKSRIIAEDLYLPPNDFKDKFPKECFTQTYTFHPFDNIALFTNQLFRCYYMVSHSAYHAYAGYFKLFETKGKYYACMILGIQDFELPQVKAILNNFDTPENLKKAFAHEHTSFISNKKLESLNLYIAEHEDILFTNNCIRIHFTSIEDDPCRCTMFWNIRIINEIKRESYIGGSALVVDTNDGRRGRDIAAFKMGLEHITNSETDKKPFNTNSMQLIAELSLQTKNGVMTVDNSDDSHWFRFLQEDINRDDSPDLFKDIDMHKLVRSLLELRSSYAVEVERLKTYNDNREKES